MWISNETENTSQSSQPGGSFGPANFNAKSVNIILLRKVPLQAIITLCICEISEEAGPDVKCPVTEFFEF